LHVAKDPTLPKRARIWWHRGDSGQATQACQREFNVGNVRRTHEQMDAEIADGMKSLYDQTITFGGHPNQGAIASSLRVDRSQPDAVTVRLGILPPGTLVALSALKAAINGAVGVAKTTGLIYPERFQIAGVDDEIGQLVRHSGEVFPSSAELVTRSTSR